MLSQDKSASENQSQVSSKRRHGNKKNAGKANHVENLAPISLPHKMMSTIKSQEKGFTGNPTSWWDEDRYKRPKGASKATFDGADKHDYYFGSYSSHHIHEEMLKDRHRTMTY